MSQFEPPQQGGLLQDILLLIERDDFDVADGILRLHRAEKRYYLASYPEQSFSSIKEAGDYFAPESRTIPLNVESFEVCVECARIEHPKDSLHDYENSLYPCRTVQLITLLKDFKK